MLLSTASAQAEVTAQAFPRTHRRATWGSRHIRPLPPGCSHEQIGQAPQTCRAAAVDQKPLPLLLDASLLEHKPQQDVVPGELHMFLQTVADTDAHTRRFSQSLAQAPRAQRGGAGRQRRRHSARPADSTSQSAGSPSSTTDAAAQQWVSKVLACASLADLSQQCQSLHACDARDVCQQPRVITAVASRLEALLRAHTDSIDDIRTLSRFEQRQAHGNTDKPSRTAAHMNAVTRPAVRHVARLLCEWVKSSAAAHTGTPAPLLRPYQAATVLHALARAARLVGRGAVSGASVAALQQALVQSQQPAEPASTPAAASQSPSEPGPAAHSATCGLIPAQLVTVAWSLAVLTHGARTDTAQTVTGTGDRPVRPAGPGSRDVLQWLYSATEPVLHSLTPQQLTRLLWSLATLATTAPAARKHRPGSQKTGSQQAQSAHTAAASAAVEAGVCGGLPGDGWWRALEDAMLRPCAPATPPATAQSAAPQPSRMQAYAGPELALCCWAVSRLARPDTATSSTATSAPPGQQPSQQGHGLQAQPDVSPISLQQSQFPSSRWLGCLLACLWRLYQQQSPPGVAGGAQGTEHAGGEFLPPAKLSALLSGLARLQQPVPPPLLGSLVQAALVRAPVAHYSQVPTSAALAPASCTHHTTHPHVNGWPLHSADPSAQGHSMSVMVNGAAVNGTPVHAQATHTSYRVQQSGVRVLYPDTLPHILVPTQLPAHVAVNGVVNGQGIASAATTANGSHAPAARSSALMPPPVRVLTIPPLPAGPSGLSCGESRVGGEQGGVGAGVFVSGGVSACVWVLPLPQLVEVVRACVGSGAVMPHDALTHCAISFEVALSQCTAQQLVRLAAGLTRMGLCQPRPSLTHAWLAALHPHVTQVKGSSLQDPRLHVAVLQVLTAWRVWPGTDWLSALLHPRMWPVLRKRQAPQLLMSLTESLGDTLSPADREAVLGLAEQIQTCEKRDRCRESKGDRQSQG